MRCGREAFRGQADTREPRTKNSRPATELLLPNLLTAGSRLRNASQNAFMAAAVCCTTLFFPGLREYSFGHKQHGSQVLASTIQPGRLCVSAAFDLSSRSDGARCPLSSILKLDFSQPHQFFRVVSSLTNNGVLLYLCSRSTGRPRCFTTSAKGGQTVYPLPGC